jgi:hypothetical protein
MALDAPSRVAGHVGLVGVERREFGRRHFF